MITKLHLDSFGLYRNVSFKLAPVTAFVGPNESGKTTLFHALMDALCRPRGNSSQARALQARYGKARASRVEPPDREGSIPLEEFSELLAIDSGDITLSVSEDSDWMQAVKARLFSGGIDPNALAAELQKEASENKTLAHMKRLKLLQSRLETHEQDRDRLAARRAEILKHEQRLQARTREHDELDTRLQALLGQHRELEQQIAAQSATLERQRAKTLLAKMEALQTLDGELAQRSAFALDAEGQLHELQTRLEDARSRHGQATSACEHRETERDHALSAFRDAERAAAAQQRLGEAAKSLRRSLEQNRPVPITRTRRRPRPVVLAAAAVVLAAAALPAFILEAPLNLIVGGALGVAALVTGLLAGFIHTVEHDYTPVEDALRRTRDEWRRETGEELSVESYEGLISALSAVESRAVAAGDELERRRNELSGQEQKLSEAQADEQRAAREAAAAEQDLRERLTGYGVHTLRDYHNARADYQSRTRRRDELIEELRHAARQYGCDSLTALRSELLRLLEQSERSEDSEQTETGATDSEALRRLEARRSRLDRELEQVRAERDRAASEIAELRGRVQGSLGEIPEQLLALETQIAELEREIDELNRKREAAGIAAEIFTEISADSDHVLEELAGDIRRQLGSITGTERHLTLPRLAIDAAEVVDAGGTARPPAQLSRGTHDAFLFAARIALALKIRDGGGLLVLDEPFVSFDQERTRGALTLLREVNTKHGTQLLLFTKDERLLETCREVFGDLPCHRLDGGTSLQAE